MTVSRRAFLRGLFAAPFVAKAEWLMPVKPLPLLYLPGDLINFKGGMWQDIGWWAVCEPLLRVDGQNLVFRKYQHGDRTSEIKVPARYAELFHGLPGNRVNNPSMHHRLIRNPMTLGLAYPEDLTRTNVHGSIS